MKYRFKTKQEFEDEFGENWIYTVGWNNIGKMDYLFGTVLNQDFSNEAYEIQIYDPTFHIHWSIYKIMLKELKPDYSPRKIIREL